MQNPEPRFYPSFWMKTDLETWRELPQRERASRAMRFGEEIRALLFERVQQIHSNWNIEQQKLMFFRLCYAGEHFETFAQAKIKRGDLSAAEVEVVRATPLPQGEEDGACYAAISHPDIDETLIKWPSASERAAHI